MDSSLPTLIGIFYLFIGAVLTILLLKSLIMLKDRAIWEIFKRKIQKKDFRKYKDYRVFTIYKNSKIILQHKDDPNKFVFL